jgi:glycosyltransferase involved in cell wall biosynthesis
VRATFIVWARDGKHSEQLAARLGASVHFVQWGRRGRALTLPLRYLVQAAITWRHLLRERPAVVLVQNPPIFAVLACFLYARVAGARLVVSSHTAAFVEWGWSLPLHRAISRRAAATIVHNRDNQAATAGWRCPIVRIGYVPGELAAGEPYRFEADGFRVAVISTMAEDEPLDLVFAAAARMPDVQFYVTGRAERLPSRLRELRPANCHLTGYLPYERYAALLRDAHVVLDLTLRDQTVLMGGFEAVALGTPLVTSDWPVLRDYFNPGAVHVPNTVEGICAGIRLAERDLARLREEVVALRARLEGDFDDALARLRARLV